MTEALVQYQAQDLALPDAEFLTRELQAIKKFQQLVHANLIEGQDYGIIPGTQKPTLLQPGAQKVTKLLGLTDHYEILNSVENWDKPFFRYLIKCSLRSVRTGATISECIAECNSYETRYRYRWLFISQLPERFNRAGAVSKAVTLKDGSKTTQYRTDNDEIYSQVNTLVKMANKRGLVGAALSAGRLSEIFTQDMEDIGTEEAIEGTATVIEDVPFTGPRCPTHPTRTPKEWGGRGSSPAVWKCTSKTGSGPKDFCIWTAPREVAPPYTAPPDNGLPPTEAAQKPSAAEGMGTATQMSAIRQAAESLWEANWRSTLRAWLTANYDIDKAVDLTAFQAHEAIFALESQLADQRAAADEAAQGALV